MKKKANRLAGWISIVVFFAAGFVRAAIAQEPAVGPAAPLQWQVTSVDGKVFKANSLAIDAAGKVTGLMEAMQVDDLRTITILGAKVSPITPEIIAELPGGGRLFAEKVSLASERCTFTVGGREIVLPIDVVRAIRLDPKAVHEPFDAVLANPAAEEDTIFFRAEDRSLVSATGLTEKFGADKLEFDFEGAARSIDRDLVWGIVFAGTATTANVSPATVTTLDGASLPGKVTAADAEKLTLAMGKGDISLPWSLIARVDFRSSRVSYLSDLKPVAQEQTPLVTAPLPSKPDKNVLGNPLRLGNETFEKGWGTHAHCRLVFDAGDGYDLLLATVGHDPSTRGRGDCLIVVQGDGQELFSQRLKGSDAPLDLRVNVKGMKKVTLLVEPGEDLDLADLVNWCDLRFLRQEK